MEWSLFFVGKSVLLGGGLAMDAFSVSLAHGLHEPRMRAGRRGAIAGVFAFFQALMPMLGWSFMHLLLQYFRLLERLIPWLALTLLAYIGHGMVREGLRGAAADALPGRVGWPLLIMQGGATSLDALSAGFTIAGYGIEMALACSLIIAAVTFFACLIGIRLGCRFGLRFSSRAQVLGGLLLLFVGLHIFIMGLFFSA